MDLVDDRSLANLEFPAVVRAVADRASSGPGRSLALGIAPIRDRDALEARRGLVTEIGSLIHRVGPGPRGLPDDFDLAFLDDIGPLFDRLGRGGVLEGAEVLGVARILRPAAQVARISGRERERLPRLFALAGSRGLRGEDVASDLESVDLEIAATLDPDGRVRDGASPELAAKRRLARDLRTRLAAQARALTERFAAFLQDAFYTLRDDRYVLPVRSESRGSVRGIIHGSSNSGATLFIEPEALVDGCNEVKVVEGEAAAIEAEIVRGLCGLLAERTGKLRSAHGMLVEIDLAMAIARFGEDVGGRYADLSDDPVLDLKGLAHPLLALSGRRVVRNDLAVGSGGGCVVSGPNAGGKTVLIKAAGLAAIMTRAGLPIPSAEGSIVGRFETVRAEIGDAQSIEGDLSTFSAQARHLAAIYSDVGAASLVILDELAAGTDPDEGAALAEAFVLSLVERGAALLVATHFEALKRLSIADDRLDAYGMGIDPVTLEPTFALHVGTPGSSAGLLVAERFGLPGEVVTRARRIFAEGSGASGVARLEAVVRLQGDLERRLGEVEKVEAVIRSREIKVEAREKKLVDGERRRIMAEQAYLTTELTVLRSELKHAHRLIRRRPLDREDVRSTERVASRVGRTLAPGGPVAAAIRPRREVAPAGEPPRAGDVVYVPRLDLEGTVEGVDDGKVRIRKGAIAWTVDASEVARPAGGQADQKGGTKMTRESGAQPPPDDDGDEERQSSYNTIDLRGRGLDEAQIDLDTFLDNSIEMGIETVYVIHGHGTGTLKNGLRRYLRHLKKVASFRPGDRGEGGDGATVCKLRLEEG